MSLPRPLLSLGSILLGVGLGILSVAGCSGSADDSPTPTPTSTPGPTGDQDPPLITFEPIPEGQPINQSVLVEAQLNDASGISTASLFYRAPGTSYWASVFLSRIEADRWQASIPAAFVQEAGVDYYLKATDDSANRNSSYAPPAGSVTPYHFSVAVPGLSFPVVSTFEPPAESSSWTLKDTGWREFVLGFDDGVNWQLTQDQALSGSWSAFHDHGSPFQVSDFDDYLVSPAIDLQDATAADLYWWELADFGEYARHELYVSTSSPDPRDGGFEALADPLLLSTQSEDQWARSLHLDLSPYVGEAQVFVAWRYQGRWGDDWYLDDITLELPRADLVLGSATFDPAGVEPGESTTLTLSVRNEGLVASQGLEVEVSSSDPLIELDSSPLLHDPISSGDQVQVGPISVQVDPAHVTDVFVPVLITVKEGGRSWQLETRLMVGRPALAHIQITHPFEDDLALYVGYGDPTQPTFRTLVQADEGGNNSGTFTWDVDLSAQQAALPPDYQAYRWFLQVLDDSVSNAGTVDQFWIDVGPQRYDSDGLPQSIPDDGSSLFVFIPGQARPAIRGVEQEPEVAAPGQSLALSFVIDNQGAAPASPFVGTLTSSDPDVLELQGGPISFVFRAAEPEPGDEARKKQAQPTLSSSHAALPLEEPEPTSTPTPTPQPGTQGFWVQDQPFTLRVAASHVSSLPLELMLELSDGQDTWKLPVSVPVPYPVLGGLGLFVEDSTDGSPADWALSPGESTQLRLRVRNTGTAATFGALTATATLLSTSTTGAVLDRSTASITGDSGNGVLGAGEGGQSETFPIRLSGGKNGDILQLEVAVTDGTITLREQRLLTLGQVPWNPLTVIQDPKADANGIPLDLQSGSFQLAGTRLTWRWRSYSTFDIHATYLYSFLSGKGAYQYAVLVSDVLLFYQWVASGDGSTGYWSRRYTNPTSLTGRQIDAQTVEMSIDLNEIYLETSPLYGGASAGNCGGSTGCDYAPDASNLGAGLTRFWWN